MTSLLGICDIPDLPAIDQAFSEEFTNHSTTEHPWGWELGSLQESFAQPQPVAVGRSLQVDLGNSTVSWTQSALDDLPLPTRIFHGMLTCSFPIFSAPLPISHWKHLPEARRKALRVLKSYAASMGSKVRCDVPGYWISMGDSNGDILGIYQP